MKEEITIEIKCLSCGKTILDPIEMLNELCTSCMVAILEIRLARYEKWRVVENEKTKKSKK
jgi:DNA-directed RNA polymerase subunit N (RpoN/RPB10)